VIREAPVVKGGMERFVNFHRTRLKNRILAFLSFHSRPRVAKSRAQNKHRAS